jgi:pimeloyl-ACP methyl ester carboxylesterase
MTGTTTKREHLFLLHGIAANRWMMYPLARRLRGLGFEVHNWGYLSIFGSIEAHGQRLAQAIADVAAADPQATIHIVAHSMGSIVTRCALERLTPPPVRKVVFLSPPHHGAPLANWLGPWLRPVCPLIDQLAAREDSFVNRLVAPAGVEFGVIAAGLDWLVPLDSTHLVGEREHTVVRTLHSGLLFRDDVAQMIANFLRHSHFQPAAPSASLAAAATTDARGT